MEENTEHQTQETVSMTKIDFDKAIQSAEDKLRTNYSKQIKELQDKIDTLAPKEKSKEELEFETKVKDFESKQKELDAKERKLNLQTTLSAKGIDTSFVDFLKDDIDIDKFDGFITSYLSDKTKALGYVPTGHRNNDGVSIEEWNKMPYSEKTKLYETNPTLAKKLMGH